MSRNNGFQSQERIIIEKCALEQLGWPEPRIVRESLATLKTELRRKPFNYEPLLLGINAPVGPPPAGTSKLKDAKAPLQPKQEPPQAKIDNNGNSNNNNNIKQNKPMSVALGKPEVVSPRPASRLVIVPPSVVEQQTQAQITKVTASSDDSTTAKATSNFPIALSCGKSMAITNMERIRVELQTQKDKYAKQNEARLLLKTHPQFDEDDLASFDACRNRTQLEIANLQAALMDRLKQFQTMFEDRYEAEKQLQELGVLDDTIKQEWKDKQTSIQTQIQQFEKAISIC